MQYVIETKRLCKTYGGRTVVHNLDLHVPQGCVYGFIGPNGAGKSTSMKMLLGLVHPTAGSVALLGRTLTERTRLELLRQTGSLIESPSGYLHLTAQENLEIVADLKGVPYKDIDRVLEIVHLQADRKRKVGQYSLGMKQRLGIAMALLGSPRLLILDEPTNGLDPAGIQEMRALIHDMPDACGATVLISSHLLGEMEQIVSQVGIINHGQLRWADMYTSIRAELQKARRRHDLIVCLLVPVMALLWCQSAAPTGADELASAYSALFYSLPIINTILMPLAMAILASRLWDVEVKGCTPKLLYTLQSRRSLFAAKAALGLAEIFLIVTLEAAGAPLIGHLQHYTQPYPAAGQAAYLWGCTFAVDCMIFFSELLLTVLLANPLPALCVGILGTLLGLFSAFMPAWVGYFVPWGYFIPLNTYRIADWDQASKVVTYMIVPFQWPLLVATVVLAGILFFAAWYAMWNKEV